MHPEVLEPPHRLCSSKGYATTGMGDKGLGLPVFDIGSPRSFQSGIDPLRSGGEQWSRGVLWCFLLEEKCILDSVDWADIQTASATEAIGRPSPAINQTFGSLHRACLDAKTAFGAPIFVDSDTEDTDAFGDP